MGILDNVCRKYKITLTDESDAAIMDAVSFVELRERGIAPDHYTSVTDCTHCGPVPIWQGCPPAVLGCPWCINRHENLPIPKENK